MVVGIKLEIREKEGVKCVYLEGRLDAVSTPVLEGKLAKLLEVSDRLLIDFSKVDYLSSAGLRLLLSSTKKMKAKEGRLAFSGMGEDVIDIIQMAGFERILNIYSSEDKALKALSKGD
jgi:anti-sigma B factor antagonist/stage II sporulation protein AA (anti-sigma F factor antagonist)